MEAVGKVTYRVGDLLVDLGRGQVTRGGDDVPLPNLSFRLFVALLRAAPDLVTQDELMRQVWPGLVVTPETVSQRVKLLRQSLNDDPRQPRYVAGMRGRGYRVVAPVEIVTAVAPLPSAGLVESVATAAQSIPVDSGRDPAPVRPARRRRMALAAAAGVATILVLAGLAVRGRQGTDGAASPSETHRADTRPVLAVLPFAVIGGSDDHLSLPDGLQTDILTEVSRSRALDVIAATSVEQFRGTTLSAKDIGARLGATHLLEGGVQRVGDHVRINAQLIDAPTQSHVWAATYDRELTPSNLFAVQREITVAVAEALQVALASDRRSQQRPVPTISIEAWAMDKAARMQLERRTSESMAEAERLFRRAIALDPKFARAYAGLADAVWLRADQEGLPWLPAASEAERLVNLALRLDGTIPEAWATRAKLAQERKDYATAEAAYRRAFELNPSYARAHSWYAQMMYQLGRVRESSEAARRAAELDPLSASLLVNMGLAAADPLDPTEALRWMDKARAADPSHPSWARGRALVLAYAGQFDAALHWDLAALKLDPSSRSGPLRVGVWHVQLDDLEGARTWLAEATREGREPAGAFGYAAMVHLYAGETDAALANARRALASNPGDANAYMVLDAVSLSRGAVEAVIATVRENVPELSAPEQLSVGRASLVPATDLALALRLSGDTTGSDELLEAVTRYLDAARRDGSAEFAMHEVRVAAIRGDRAGTLHLLESLVDRGWPREHWRYYRDHDPAFNAVRSEPRFRRFFSVVEEDVRARRLRAAESGDLGRTPPEAGKSADGDPRSVTPRLVRQP